MDRINVSEYLTQLENEKPVEFNGFASWASQMLTNKPVPATETSDRLNYSCKDANVSSSDGLLPVKVGYKTSLEAISYADRSTLPDANALKQAILAIESKLMLRPLIVLSQFPNCESLGSEKLQ